jgi:hypothetical protein
MPQQWHWWRRRVATSPLHSQSPFMFHTSHHTTGLQMINHWIWCPRSLKSRFERNDFCFAFVLKLRPLQRVDYQFLKTAAKWIRFPLHSEPSDCYWQPKLSKLKKGSTAIRFGRIWITQILFLLVVKHWATIRSTVTGWRAVRYERADVPVLPVSFYSTLVPHWASTEQSVAQISKFVRYGRLST